MTSGLVQSFLYTVDPTVTPGGIALSEDPSTSNRRTVETYRAGGSITAGDWVQWDITAGTGALMCATVIEAAASAIGGNLVCGVALKTVTSGQFVDVVTRGFVLKASAETNVTAGAVCGAGFAGTGSGVAGQAQRLVVIDTSGAADTIPVPAQCGVALTAEGTLADDPTVDSVPGFAAFYVTCGR